MAPADNNVTLTFLLCAVMFHNHLPRQQGSFRGSVKLGLDFVDLQSD